MKRVVILSDQDGDWEALYIDGKLIDEGHTLGEGNHRIYLLEQSEKYNFKSKDIIEDAVNDIDNEMVMDRGNFPKSLDELNGIYDEEDSGERDDRIRKSYQ